MYTYIYTFTCTCTYVYGNLICTYALSGQASSPGDRTLLPATPTGLCQVESVQRRLRGEPLHDCFLMDPQSACPLSYFLPSSLSLSFCLIPPLSHSLFLTLPLTPSLLTSLSSYLPLSLSPLHHPPSPPPSPSFSPCSRHGVLFNQRILWSYWTTPTKTPTSVPMPCAVSTHSRKLQL